MRRWSSVLLPVSATRGLPLLVIEHRSPASALPLRGPEGPADAAIGALDHVVVVSGDLDASRAVYRDALELRLALDRGFEERGLRILFFRVGGVTVEVVGPLDAAATAAGADRFGGLAYRVADVDAARAAVAGGRLRRLADARAATSPAPASARCAAAPAVFRPCSWRRKPAPER